MRIPLATAAAAQLVVGLPEKRCQNLYIEPDPTDPERPESLVETPGSRIITQFAGAVRGMAQADGHAGGKVLIVQGSTVSTFETSTATVAALTGTVAGTDNVDIAFTQTEAAILGNGVIHVSDGSSVATATDTDFPAGITSIASIGQRILFTYGAAGRFGWTVPLDIDNTEGGFYTAEQAPDNLVCVRILGDDIYLFGTDTIEIWAQTGVEADPFQLQPGRVIQTGCLARDGVQVLDRALCFVADDFTVRLFEGDTPVIISQPWISRRLRAADKAQIRSWAYEDEGHSFYGVWTPGGCYVFDLMTRQWATRQSLGFETWRYNQVVEAAGSHYATDTTRNFDELARAYTSERKATADSDGTEIVREFTAFLPLSAGRPVLSSVMLEAAQGVGVDSGQGIDPIISMRISADNGATFGPWRDRGLGRRGEYSRRTIWRRCGRSGVPGSIFHFRKSDPVSLVVKGILVNAE